MNQWIAFMAPRSGTGKTCCAVHSAAALAIFEQPTLLIDLDPLGAATRHLGFFQTDLQGHFGDWVEDHLPFESLRKATSLKFLDILPSQQNLAAWLWNFMDPHTSSFSPQKLSLFFETLRKLPYRYILFDTSSEPHTFLRLLMGQLQGVIMPAEPHENTGNLWRHFQERLTLLPPGAHAKLLINAMRHYQKEHQESYKQLVKNLGNSLATGGIPWSPELTEAAQLGKCCLLCNIESPASLAFLAWTRQLLTIWPPRHATEHRSSHQKGSLQL